jgi:hypothetical protein
MTPKEKAKDIIDIFLYNGEKEPQITYDYAKECALICVEEIIGQIRLLPFTGDVPEKCEEVKTEIEKL